MKPYPISEIEHINKFTYVQEDQTLRVWGAISFTLYPCKICG